MRRASLKTRKRRARRFGASGNNRLRQGIYHRRLHCEMLEDRRLLSADLIAYGISVSDTRVDPGQAVTVNWTAKNQGFSATGIYPFGASQQGIMWSTNNTITRSDPLLEREFLGWMGAGNTSPESHSIRIPSSASPGSSYWIGGKTSAI